MRPDAGRPAPASFTRLRLRSAKLRTPGRCGSIAEGRRPVTYEADRVQEEIVRVHGLGRFVLPMLLLVAVAFAWLGTASSPLRQYSLDQSAQVYVDQGLKRALVTFATARTLNAALSLAQGTQISAQPLGVGVQISLGQLLRPINEIVGQFADLMLVACIAFGAMEILIRVGSHWSVTIALSLVALSYAACRWRGTAAPSYVGKVLAVLLLVRFAIPAVSIASEAIYRTFMAEDYKANQQAITLSMDRIGQEAPAQPDQVAPARKKEDCRMLPDWLCRKLDGGPSVEQKVEPKGDAGVLDRMKGALPVDVPGRIGKLGEVAESMTEHVVMLMVVFLLQTLVIPLTLGWALLRGVGMLLQGSSRTAP